MSVKLEYLATHSVSGLIPAPITKSSAGKTWLFGAFRILDFDIRDVQPVVLSGWATSFYSSNLSWCSDLWQMAEVLAA